MEMCRDARTSEVTVSRQQGLNARGVVHQMEVKDQKDNLRHPRIRMHAASMKKPRDGKSTRGHGCAPQDRSPAKILATQMASISSPERQRTVSNEQGESPSIPSKHKEMVHLVVSAHSFSLDYPGLRRKRKKPPIRPFVVPAKRLVHSFVLFASFVAS